MYRVTILFIEIWFCAVSLSCSLSEIILLVVNWCKCHCFIIWAKWMWWNNKIRFYIVFRFAFLFLPKNLNGSPSKLLLKGFLKAPFSTCLDQKLGAQAIMLEWTERLVSLIWHAIWLQTNPDVHVYWRRNPKTLTPSSPTPTMDLVCRLPIDLSTDYRHPCTPTDPLYWSPHKKE